MKSESQVEAALLKVKSLCIWCLLLNVPQSRSKYSREEEYVFFVSVREDQIGLTASKLLVSSELY
jgi:hypothetical protein